MDPREEVQKEYIIVAEFIEYFAWLAAEDGEFQLTANDVRNLYILTVQLGEVWSEACEQLDLPVNPDWS